ncbi:hypothetical protein A2U01_0092554, partial [Trifolium medium]|nr:hypothetical protein [Trifolium medium]
MQNQSRHIMQLVQSHASAKEANRTVMERSRMVMHVGWQLLPGWVKLNADGARKDTRRVGCGGIIRGSKGEWIG